MKSHLRTASLILLAAALAACATEDDTSPASDDDVLVESLLGISRDAGDFEAQLEQASGFDLGSEQNPVRVDKPEGQRAYLERLNCADGSTPEYSRVGSFDIGPYGTVLDGYQLTCSGVDLDGVVYMDMYHPGHIEAEAIPGFTID